MQEAKELCQPTDMYIARPLEVRFLLFIYRFVYISTFSTRALANRYLFQDNLFEWHFTIRGPPDSPYEGGLYHGRIILPDVYPHKPPNFVILTVSALELDISLSNSHFSLMDDSKQIQRYA